MSKRLRDQCLDLADYALIDEPELRRRKTTELATHLQQAIEDWIEQQKQEASDD